MLVDTTYDEENGRPPPPNTAVYSFTVGGKLALIYTVEVEISRTPRNI
jgi:hypothetical protein